MERRIAQRDHVPMSTFLVLGGTGKVGRRLTLLLREAGHTVRVASRTHGDTRFDWRDPATYAPALAGADGVFVVGPGSATDWTGLLTPFLDQAAAAGVSRVVLLSARGVEFLPGGVVARAEAAVRSGPLPWTILRPSHFAQNFTEAMFVPVDGELRAPVGDGAQPFLDVLDLAEVAAAVLTGDEHVGATIELSGPAALTFSKALDVLGDSTGQTFRFVAEDGDQHADRLRAAGTPEGYVVWRMAMLDGIRRGADDHVSDGVPRVLGRPATDFRTWASREAAALVQPRADRTRVRWPATRLR
jgi:uncharacterized protein YbjT (DUF2867 family)